MPSGNSQSQGASEARPADATAEQSGLVVGAEQAPSARSPIRAQERVDGALVRKATAWTAWEEASNGKLDRLVSVYAKTIVRARRNKPGRTFGLLPRAITFGLTDHFGHAGAALTMLVKHDAIAESSFFVAKVYAPTRDGGCYGYHVMPPPYFKEALRQWVIRQNEETVH